MTYKINYITKDWISTYAKKLHHFSNITEDDIQNIWIQDGDKRIKNYSKMVYTSNMPIFKKMIFHFALSNRSACSFWIKQSIYNKLILLKYFGMDYEETRELIDFFHWITQKNWLYILSQLDNRITIDNFMSSEYFTYMKNYDQINFFWLLDPEKQQRVIDIYNENVVDLYNSFIN